MTHDYKRHGTTTLFAALNSLPRTQSGVLTGEVFRRNVQRQRHQKFIRILNALERDIPTGKVVHVILDNGACPRAGLRPAPWAAHKYAKVRAWLNRHPRWTLHFTPASSSWLNAVEGFFAKLSRQRQKNGAFCSVAELQAAFNRFVVERNQSPKPLVRRADPDPIIAARSRGFQALASIH
jgi:transposase